MGFLLSLCILRVKRSDKYTIRKKINELLVTMSQMKFPNVFK